VRVRSTTNPTDAAAALVLLAHAVDVGPEALLQPADLLEDELAAVHLLAAVAGHAVGQLVDERAARVDELDEGGGRPVGDEGLVQDGDVRVGRGLEGLGKGGGVGPGGAVGLEFEGQKGGFGTSVWRAN
jgi:hypothetical protein